MKQTVSRFAAVFILLAMIALLWQVLFQPFWTSASIEREQRAQYLERTARQHLIQTRSAEFTKWLQETPDSVISDRIYVAKTVNSAETLLQRDVSNAAQQAGAVINAIEGAPARKAGGLTQLTVRVNLSANSDQLAALLANLKANTRVISVAKAGVRVRRPEDSLGPADLAVNLDLIGYGKV